MKKADAHDINKIVRSDGERSVSIGGDVIGTVINTGTGDVNIYPQANQSNLSFDIGLMTKVVNLSTELSKEKAKKFEELREKFREGQTRKAFEEIQLLRNSQNWDVFEAPLRASILQALANMVLVLKGSEGVDEALKLADESRNIDAAQDDFSLRARIKISKDGYEAALSDLSKYKDTESYNLWLTCLLNTGKQNDVIDSLRKPPEGINLNAESHRLFSLALLASKNIDEAQIEIKKVLAEKPDWQYVRFTASIIDYFSSISPTALPNQIVPYPRPLFLNWVKVDNESQQRLLRAASEFQKLAEQFKAGGREGRELETWHFACLANVMRKQQEAIEIGRELLERDPSNLQILSWFIVRDYEFDLTRSLDLLEQKKEGNVITLEDVLGLIGIYHKLGRFSDALEVIDARKELFTLAGEKDLWNYWRGISFLKNKQTQEASDEEAKISGELKTILKTNILNYEAEELGNWKPLIAFLQERYEKDNDFDSFLSLYELKELKTKDAKFITENAELYCDLMGTAAAVNFVVNALWNADNPQKCLDVLTKFEFLFPSGKLPTHLRVLKIHCLIKIDIKKALEEAEELTKDDNNVENIKLLMDVHLSKGDLTGLQVTSKKLLHRTDVTAEDFLRAAHLVQVKDRNLAIKLWTRAIEIGVPDNPELILFAHSLAAKLGLEDRSRDLTIRMMDHAHQGQGPLKPMTIRQFLKLMEKRWNFLKEVDRENNTAALPLHILSKEKNVLLAEIFNIIAHKNKEKGDLHNSPRILTRHGARILPPVENFANSKKWRLHIDITSILIAHKLGILDKLENLFKPLKISRHTVTALIEQRDKMRPHQKSQLDSSEIITDLYERKKFRLVDQLPSEESLNEIRNLVEENKKFKAKNLNQLSKKKGTIKKRRIVFADAKKLKQQLGDRLDQIALARSEKGFAVGMLPINCYGTKDYSTLKLPESIGNQIIDCRSIVDSLKGNNRISEEIYKKAIISLGSEGNSLYQVSPLISTQLFMMSDVADLLANAGVLDVVCENFEVILSKDSLQEAKNKVKNFGELEEVGNAVEELINRINDGIDEGVYEFIRVLGGRIKKDKISSGKLGQDFKSTMDLFLYELNERDVICIDERALNKYSSRQENQIFVPLIGINELLLALWQNGEIDEQRYYNLLLELRRSNFRYIHLTEEEILFHLKLAPMQNGRIVETEALSVLRQYHASCLLDKEYLQILDNSPFSELPFVIHGTEAVGNAIASIWKDQRINNELAEARADWIFDNLYTGRLGCSHLLNEPDLNTDVFDVNKIAFDVSNLLMRGMLLIESIIPEDGETKRSQYFKWLTDKVLLTYCVSTPSVIKAIASQIEGRLRFLRDQEHNSQQEKVIVGYFVGRFFLDLPEVIAKEIDLDAETSNWMRVRVANSVDAGGVNFDAEDYWEAVEKALTGEKVSIKSAVSDAEYFFLLEKTAEGNESDELFPTIKITDSEGNEIGLVNDPSFGALTADVQTRLSAIRKLRNWFDCDQAEFDKEANEIANVEDSLSRVTRFYNVREKSTVYFYARLEERFRERDLITWKELLPPALESLAGYFRLPLSTEGKNFDQIWQKTAQTLLNEEDLSLAMSRCSCLPVPMPDEVIESFSLLADEEKINTLRKLSRPWSSPIQLLHLVNLAIRTLPAENEPVAEIIKDLLSRLYEHDKDPNNFQAFQAILTFVKDEFRFWIDSSTWSPEIVLALIWGHSSRLYNINRAVGVEAENIVIGLSGRRNNIFSETLTRNPGIWSDCLHPRQINRTKFLTHAAANLFKGIDITVLESFDIPNLIRKEVFREREDDTPNPSFTLWRDPVLNENKLQSLFGGNRFEILSQIIGSEGIEIFDSENLKQCLKEYLEMLVNNPEKTKPWGMVHLIANDLPVYPDLKELCFEALKKFDPLTPYEENVFENPSFIFSTVASQVPYYNDENLRAKFRNHILESVKKILSIYDSTNGLELMATLVDAALVLSYRLNDPIKSNEEFVSLLEEINDIWKDFKERFGYGLSNLIWDMPVNESKYWRTLNLKIRTNIFQQNNFER